jgi:hypothetical protein
MLSSSTTRCCVALLTITALCGEVVGEETPPPPQCPRPVVERFLTLGKQTTRVSLFDNRVAVVSMSEDGHQTFFRSRTLSDEEYIGYLAAVVVDETRRRARESHISVESTHGEVLIYRATGDPLRIEYSPLEVEDLQTAHLLAALDDLQSTLESIGPYLDEVRNWRPQPGDRVELNNGETATVVELRDDEVMVLRHGGGTIMELVPIARREQVVYRVLSDGS